MPPTVESLHRDLRRSQRCAIGLAVALVTVVGSAYRSQSGQVLRVRGIIVEDAAGHERILIGAPIPQAANRVRTDTARVRRYWAGRYPNQNQYMGYYSAYRNDMNGMLVLDERGFDRLAVGDSLPDPNIGKRIGTSSGIIVNDSLGDERTGYGLIRANGQYRVTLGLDSRRGEEGIGLGLFDGGGAYVFVRDGQNSMLLGGTSELKATGKDSPFFGIAMRQGDSLKKRIEP
jgi:hypothetical protein